MSKKKYYMVLDTETVSTAAIPYDIAYTIIDREGNIISQKNYLTEEIFYSPIGKHLLVHDDFSKNKIHNYLQLMKDAETKTFAAIREEMRKTIKKYNCVVVAYNAKFDFECLTNFAQSLGFKNFFKPRTQIWDLWNIALNILADSARYVKFCNENNLCSDKGNLKSSAEVMYRYLTKNNDFVEEHTALADTEIEAAILLACLKRHKKLHTEYVGQVFRHPVWINRCKG